MRLGTNRCCRNAFLWVGLSLAVSACADWPVLHGNPRHDGFIPAELKPPFRLSWVRHFAGERLGTAMEPIEADGKVFVATHSGGVYALDAQTGAPKWGVSAPGAFLHSPAYADGLIVAGCTDGNLYGLDAKTGKIRWSRFTDPGGFAASPAIFEGEVFIGTRNGNFLAAGLRTGREFWRRPLGAPVRQTAAVADGRVFVTAEDLRVRCLDARNGTVLWTSEPLAGQSARDYYPVVVDVAGRRLIIVRTNPAINMAERIARDRHLLAQNAGAEDSDWRKLDAWIKSPSSRGNQELWDKEQKAIVNYLQEHGDARSFFVLDAATGKEALTAPVLWIAGCQGVGAMPARTADGRLLVFYRSAYGNWNRGVAPLVALGLLDLQRNQITPLFHQFGWQPAWNTFWGTADESQNFVVAGNTVLIVHQGTLSGFDLRENRLFPIWGKRDTFGGLENAPSALNEWHGPARGGVAVAGNRIYWLTGSRIMCLVAGEGGTAEEPMGYDGYRIHNQSAPQHPAPAPDELRRRLDAAVLELLSRRWAPLCLEPGLAGREFFFDHSGQLFEALAWAYPQVSGQLRDRIKSFLADEWAAYPPLSPKGRYPLGDGERREWFRVPKDSLSRLGNDKPPLPFANVYAAWLYAERCGEWPRVLAAWPEIKSNFQEFSRSGWKLDGTRGDLHANRYLSSLIAFSRIAAKSSEPDCKMLADEMTARTRDALFQWWQRLTNFSQIRPPVVSGSSQLDKFIARGDALSFAVAPHRHKLALFQDLSPEVAAEVAQRFNPVERAGLFMAFAFQYRTATIVGEEPQVHFGENFVDPPDLALAAFKTRAWLENDSAPGLARQIDLPFCRADLYYLTKVALALEAANSNQGARP